MDGNVDATPSSRFPNWTERDEGVVSTIINQAVLHGTVFPHGEAEGAESNNF